MTASPKVSFVVPCYKLAHLLPECLDSILSQSFGDFEILVMDDCSPDDTPGVVARYQDPRIRHVRNNPNLGHLRNYNKGLNMAKGEYLWLISADDRLRRPYVLERYVEVLDKHPNVGYVFCPGMGLQDGKETSLVNSHGPENKVFPGRAFLTTLLHANSVVAASGMARRECYEKVSYFPTDMPWGGDWFLWCAFALHYDVAYIGEPLVHYRTHALSMTNLLTHSVPSACTQDDLVLPWRIKERAASAGCNNIVACCRHMIAYQAARSIVGRPSRQWDVHMTQEEAERSIDQQSTDAVEARAIRARLHACLGDFYFWQGDSGSASESFEKSLRLAPGRLLVWAKYALARTGKVGLRSRQTLRSLHRKFTTSSLAPAK